MTGSRHGGVEELANLLTRAVSNYCHDRGIHCSAGQAWVCFFADSDADGSGRISFEEWELAIRKRLKTDISRYQLLVLWRQLDSDHSGEVSVEEVVQFLYRVDLQSWPAGGEEQVGEAVRKLHEAGATWHQASGNWYKIFLQIDTQQRGYITLDDLKRAVRGCFYGFRLSAQDLSDEALFQLWKAMDENCEMRVPLKRFLAFMKRAEATLAVSSRPSVEEGREWRQELKEAPDMPSKELLQVAKELAGRLVKYRRTLHTPRSLATPAVWNHLFNFLDADGSGRITFLEFEACARKMGISPETRNVGLKALWRLVDADCSGEATMKEFCLALYRLQVDSWPRRSADDLKKIMAVLNAAADKWHRAGGNWFKVLSVCDEDGSGRLDFDEFAKVVRRGFPGLSLGTAELSNEDLRGLWGAMDTDRSGDVSIQEFMIFAKRNGEPSRPVGGKAAREGSTEAAAELREEDLLFVTQTLERAMLCYFDRRGLSVRTTDGWALFFAECGADRLGRLSLEAFARGLRKRLLTLPGIETSEAVEDQPVVMGVSLQELRAVWHHFAANAPEIAAKDWALGVYRLELDSWPEADDETMRYVVKTLKAKAERSSHAPNNWYKVFCAADVAQTGHVNFAEFRNAIRGRTPSLAMSRKEISSSQLKMFWRAMDVSRSGLVSLGCFLAFLRRHLQAAEEKPPPRNRSLEIAEARGMMAHGLSSVGVESLRDALESWGAEWNGFISEWDWQHIARQLLELNEDQVSDDALHGVWVELDHKDLGELEADLLLERLSLQSTLRQEAKHAPLSELLRPGSESTKRPSTGATSLPALSTPMPRGPSRMTDSVDFPISDEDLEELTESKEAEESQMPVAFTRSMMPARITSQAFVSTAPLPSTSASLEQDPALRMVAERLCEALMAYLQQRGVYCSATTGWLRFFSEMDADDSERATFAEMEAAFQKHLRSARVSRYELLMLWRRLDADGSGEVSLNEFVKLMYKYELAMWPDSTDEELARVVRIVDTAVDRWHHAAGNWYKVFLFIDTQGSGTITYEDLRRFLRGGFPDLHLGTKELHNEDIYRLWKVLDPGARMRVPKSDFLAHMRRLGALPAIMDAKRKKVPAETPRDWAAELAQAPDLGRDSLRAVAVKVLGVVQVWLARKGFSCPGPSSPEAWATLFQSVDFAGHGKLSYSSFQAAVLDRMKGRGRVSETELLALWRVVDVSRKMELREEQFSNVLYRLQTETWPRLSPADFERHIEVLNAAAHKWHRASGNWYKILTLCDEEKSGKLSFEEFNKVVRRTFPGLSISQEEISEDQLRGIWRSMDADQSGWVSVQEFMVWMRSNARNRNLHRQMNNTEAKRRLLEEQQRQEGHVPTKTMEELVSAKQQLEARVLAYLSRKGLRLKIKDSWEHVWKEADVEKYGRLSFPQLEEYLRSVVNRLDSSRSGEMKDGHYPLGIPREDLRALFAEADADRSGEVSAAEWYTMLYRLEVSSWPTSETVNVPRAVMTINSAAAKWYQAGSNWFKVFRLADDTSGRIDFSDFQNMIRHRAPGLGLNKKKISDTELKCLWRAMDADMSGDVRIEEFMVFMRRSQRERAQKEARQRLKPQSGMEDALELMVQGLSRCSVEELANAYQDWGLPWTGMVSEWEWQLIARKLLCYGEARIDDSSLHAVWTTVDTKLRGQVGASDLLATMRGLRAAKQRRAEAPADKIEPIRNPNADPYTSLVPDFSASEPKHQDLLAELTYWRSAWWTTHLRNGAKPFLETPRSVQLPKVPG